MSGPSKPKPRPDTLEIAKKSGSGGLATLKKMNIAGSAKDLHETAKTHDKSKPSKTVEKVIGIGGREALVAAGVPRILAKPIAKAAAKYHPLTKAVESLEQARDAKGAAPRTTAAATDAQGRPKAIDPKKNAAGTSKKTVAGASKKPQKPVGLTA